MKHIGIVGVTAEGASLCYKYIISESQKKLGLNNHPEVSQNNLPFINMLTAQNNDDWQEVGKLLSKSVKKLEKIGASVIVIPANSVHFAFDLIKKSPKTKLINIVDAVVAECKKRLFNKVLVLGVGITMSKGLYDDKLNKQNVEPIVPNTKEQKIINRIIYNELVKGIIILESTDKIINIIKKYKENGCEAVILGCTELPLVVKSSNCPIPFFDSTRILANLVVKLAISAKDYSN